MKSLVELMAKSLVDQPEQVVVQETDNDGVVTLELKVAEADMGKVIGKHGRIAQSMRTVLKAAAIKENRKVTLEITQ
ncbi:MAG TPA: KH domain-containing protein [Eubacteriaceae bacterium]|nr:KH domain-containing protein [Eubacteriaceae bacterium]